MSGYAVEMDWRDRVHQLYREFGQHGIFTEGLSYKEIGDIIFSEYGIRVTDDSVRYHAKRKHAMEAQRQVARVNKTTRTLVLNDIHIPFHREEVIIEIVLKHRHEIDTIIFGGDLMDCEGISSFPKEHRLPLVQEMIIAYKFLKRIDRLTPNVKKVLIWGNHEFRYVRHLEQRGNDLNPLHSNNILKEVVNGFVHHDRVNRKKTKYPPLSGNFFVSDKWYIQHGDMVIAHPKNFSRVPLRTAGMALEHFLAKGWNFKVVFIGHTHKWGSASRFGKWFGETGCLCLPMPYSDQGNVNYTPQDYGYLLITQVDGRTDVNDSKLYKLDLEDGEETWQEAEDQS